MKTNLDKRLAELEKQIKSAAESSIWIDGSNNTIRVDVNQKRGQPVTFPSVYDARLWIEGQINGHPAGGVINYSVDNVCDLHENAEELKGLVRDIIPDKITAPRTGGQVIGNEVQPLVLSADILPGTLAIRRMEPGTRADLRLWCLAGLIREYFDECAFRQRWPDLSEDDQKMVMVCHTVFYWANPGADSEAFARLFYQVTELEPLQAA